VRLTDALRTELSVHRRLEPDQVAELVAAYEQGITLKEMAARYRINRTTVLGHLRRQGVPKRHPEPIANGDTDRAVRLYSAGASVAAERGKLPGASAAIRARIDRPGRARGAPAGRASAAGSPPPSTGHAASSGVGLSRTWSAGTGRLARCPTRRAIRRHPTAPHRPLRAPRAGRSTTVHD
jgi:hypothetical protein